MNINIDMSELKEFMADQRERATRMETLTARMETKIDTLVGAPGQKGRMEKVEEDVKDLQAVKNRAFGLGIAWSVFLSIILAVWEYFVHHKS